MNELIQRTITALLLVVVLGVTLYLGGGLFWLAILMIASISYYEYSLFYEGKKAQPHYIGTSIIGILYFVGLFFNLNWILYICLFLMFFYGAFMVLLKYPKYTYKNLMSSVFGFVYCYVFSSAFYLLRGIENGLFWILFIVISIVFSDVFAYLFGRKIGKTKIAPEISPKKTLEGLVAGLIAGSVFGSIFGFIFLDIPIYAVVVFSVLGICTGVLGDLFESHLKREAHVKDSGTILPGHGGFLDRFDSIIFASGIIYVIYIFIYG